MRTSSNTPDAIYAAIAILWEETSSWKLLAERIDLGDHLPPEKIKALLYVARGRKLATSPGKGRRGGEATAKARELVGKLDPETIVQWWVLGGIDVAA
jgi:hypothetical protein